MTIPGAQYIGDKVCCRCKLCKPITEFGSVNRRGRQETRSHCLQCNRDADKKRGLNKEKIKEKNHKYYIDHSESEKARSRKWQKSHWDRVLEIAKNVRIRNPEKKKEWDRIYHKNHLERARESWHNRRATLLQVGGKIKSGEWEDLQKRYNYICLCCKKSNVKLTLDHVIPISKGGQNLITNIQPLCKQCNSSKNTKIIDYRLEYP